MEKDIQHYLRNRALEEINRGDTEGRIIELNYRERQAVKEDDEFLNGLLDKQLRRHKRSLWWLALLLPIAMASMFAFDQIILGDEDGLLYTLIAETIWTIIFLTYALSVALPRISAIERARTFLEIRTVLAARDEHVLA